MLRLSLSDEAPEPVRDYLALVSARNRQGSIRFYPGSAAIAQALMRKDDRGILLELHPQESEGLRCFVGADSRFSLHVRDCYEALPALLPPPICRSLVLIDPSYEMKVEYENIVRLLGQALRRWPNGIYMLWYPLLPERRDRLQGSGLVIVNAPWQFDEQLGAAMQYIIDTLGCGTHSVTVQRT